MSAASHPRSIAAASFDFFFTQPYLSLKIGNGNDAATTLLLVAVGLLVGETARRGRRRQSALGQDPSALLRVLGVAAEGCAEDVELSIRAELLRLLQLQGCWYTREPVTLTLLDPAGASASATPCLRPATQRCRLRGSASRWCGVITATATWWRCPSPVG